MNEETISTVEQWLEENKMPHAIFEAMEDAGYDFDTAEEAIEWIENGDFTIVYADSSDEALGLAAIEEFGAPQNPGFYIDEDYVRQDIELEAVQEDDESDEEYAERVNELVEEYIENMDEDQREAYFDYDAYGRDLRIGDGYCYYRNDGCWICTY